MTLEEAQTVGRIVGTADGGCPDCIRGLLDELREALPEFAWDYDSDDGMVKVTRTEVVQ